MATTIAKDRVSSAIVHVLFPVFVLALVLVAVRVVKVLHDPFFEGDPGQRMLMARLPVAGVGNRIWLPLLQLHIWAFHLLHLPYYMFKLIPCFYFFIAVLFLGLLSYREMTKTYANSVFTLFLMFCFAYQWEVLFVTMQLYQEALALAGFYVLLWAGATELGENKWLLPLSAAALLTRECFWIYLLVLCLLNLKKILSDSRLRAGFAFFCSIPLLWLLVTLYLHRGLGGRLPSSAVEWPLGINKEGGFAVSNLAMSAASFAHSLVDSRAIFLVGALIVVWLLGRMHRRTGLPLVERDSFDERFRPFSLLSLGIIYALIILFNPWEATFANQRMVIPLLAHAFIWTILLFQDTSTYAAGMKLLSRIVLIAGLILSLNLDVRTWTYHGDSFAERSVADIARLVKVAGENRPARVCILNENYWEALRRFAGPTLYARLIFNPKEQTISGTCDLIIAKSGFTLASNDAFKKYGDYQLLGRSYAAYQRTGSSQRTQRSLSPH